MENSRKERNLTDDSIISLVISNSFISNFVNPFDLIFLIDDGAPNGC